MLFLSTFRIFVLCTYWTCGADRRPDFSFFAGLLLFLLWRFWKEGRGCSGRLRADVKETKTDTNNTKKTTTTATTTTTTNNNNNNNNDLALSSSPPAGCLRSHATRPFLLPDNQR